MPVAELRTLPLAVRPRDCVSGPRPCPHRGCRYALPDGACALDTVNANPDGMTLDEIAAVLGVTRQAVHQMERRALKKLRRTAKHLEPEDRTCTATCSASEDSLEPGDLDWLKTEVRQQPGNGAPMRPCDLFKGRAERMRDLWKERRTLWSEADTRVLVEDTHAVMTENFGPLPAPSLGDLVDGRLP